MSVVKVWALGRKLSRGSRGDRLAAVHELAQLGGKSALSHLQRATEDESEAVRAAAIESLGALGDSGVPLLVSCLDRAAQPTQRSHIIEVLGWTRDPTAVEPVVRALESDGAWVVRRQAAQSLGDIGRRSALEALVAALRDADSRVSAVAARSLGRLGDKAAVGPLLARLRRAGAQRDRVALIEALGRLRDPRAIDPLLDALEDGDAMVRAMAARMLPRFENERVVGPLRCALRDPNKAVRDSAAAALGWFDVDLESASKKQAIEPAPVEEEDTSSAPVARDVRIAAAMQAWSELNDGAKEKWRQLRGGYRGFQHHYLSSGPEPVSPVVET